VKRVTAILAVVIVVAYLVSGVALAQSAAEFKLGFEALADQIPDVVGRPLEEEHYAPNGDSLQQTNTGLMVWRKADNWTAFTNGTTTWINGPYGIQTRLNNVQFPWEADGRVAPRSERVVMDVVYSVLPGIELAHGDSVELEAGQVTVSVELVGEGPARPVHFFLAGYRGSDQAATIEIDLSASNPAQVVTRRLAGGMYILSVWNRWPVPPNLGLSTLTNYGQLVRVKMVLAQ